LTARVDAGHLAVASLIVNALAAVGAVAPARTNMTKPVEDSAAK